MQWFLEQAMSLTFKFNKCVPNPGKRIDRILVLSSLDEIDRKIKSTRQLLKLEFANSVLLAVQYRINDEHPTDYIYRVSLFQLLSKNEDILWVGCKLYYLKINLSFSSIKLRLRCFKLISFILIPFRGKSEYIFVFLQKVWFITYADDLTIFFQSLNCSMIPLDRTSEEAKTIVKFIENSGCESTVIQIFKVEYFFLNYFFKYWKIFLNQIKSK